MKIIINLVLFGALTTLTASSLAQNKVVVIPMAGDDIKPLANIITVTKADGDFTDPVAAIDSICDASSSNPTWS